MNVLLHTDALAASPISAGRLLSNPAAGKPTGSIPFMVPSVDAYQAPTGPLARFFDHARTMIVA
jgi:hypothetical protein